MSCEFTYEDIAAFVDDDLEDERAGKLREHLKACDICAEHEAAIRQTDAALRAIKRIPPPLETILAARKAISRIIRRPQAAEIMTLAEAAEFLRITPDQLGELMEELPAFELAGQVRVRREKLVQWIEHKERDYARQRNESWVAGANVLGIGKGVA